MSSLTAQPSGEGKSAASTARTQLQAQVENATSDIHSQPDWGLIMEIVDAVNDLLLSARGYSDLLADYAGAAELAPAASRHATAASAPPSADAPAEAAADPAPEDAPAPPGVCCICYRRKARVV